MELSSEYISEIINSNKIDENLRTILNLFVIAIRNWPNEVNSLEEYVDEVENYIGTDATFANINNKVAKTQILRDAWYRESLTELEPIFSFYYTGISLREILKIIETRIVSL